MRTTLHFNRTVGIAACLLAAFLMSACSVSIALGPDRHEGQKMHMTKKCEKTAKMGPMCPMMNQGKMKPMEHVKALLTEAKNALDAGDAELAAAKIAEARDVIEQHQGKMRERMKDHKKKMPGQKCHKGMKKGPEGDDDDEDENGEDDDD